MIRCLSCNSVFATPHSALTCVNCGWTPPTIEGFRAYAPEFASGGGGFEPEYFKELAGLEADNFWFQSRNKLLLWALERYSPEFQSLLEVGCGTGYVLSGITAAYPNAKLSGSEIFTEGLKFASERLPSASLAQMDARKIPFVAEFDVVCAFDVLEHIEDDELVLRQLCAALKENGTLLVTVPQHPWLWSSVDEYSHHFRRYTESELRRKVEIAGFEVVRSTSFVTLLLPAMIVSRINKKAKPVSQIDVRSELRLPPTLNNIFSKILSCEISLIKAGMNLPAGGSRLLIARKLNGKERY